MPATKMAKLDDAIRILKSGEIRQGMEILEDLLRTDPESVNVLYNLGMCYSETGSVDKSIEILRRIGVGVLF
jgi:tetratricopeptide (TPR) repeat protein